MLFRFLSAYEVAGLIPTAVVAASRRVRNVIIMYLKMSELNKNNLAPSTMASLIDPVLLWDQSTNQVGKQLSELHSSFFIHKSLIVNLEENFWLDMQMKHLAPF